ncbi:DUF5677 domain-containing protein [Aequorivita lipolytica]|uniref:Uncharacterized protein n=1 Tax=Aequorivita lipolytica TaxID=153267 RepID=A0A5C6YLU4_9FLAO|nr:DUF5677 domain-containing protein [Aequorivita lipolytica]TXD68349.1 hypothetical protein ESV24_12875 [Aequorivita lipolytica]SRX53376.1 hypothetical protein AEQU2_02606 [Aequorivita lipolytica]
MTEKTSNQNPLELYDVIVRGPFLKIYQARKLTELTDWMQFSTLLLDKFAIHSMSFYHLSKGIVEHKNSGEQIRMNGYDLFTVNTTFRALIETYITFHNIFIEAKTVEETKFRFLLWKLDGLYQKQKYEIVYKDFEKAKEILKQDKELIEQTKIQIEESKFYTAFTENEILKIYNPQRKNSDWRFLIKSEKIRPQKIIDLVKHVCKQRAFVNMYKYTSIHSHSNFPALAEFKDTRGKPILEKYTDPIVNVATNMTCLVIMDMCATDENAQRKFNTFTIEIREYIEGITNVIKNNK